MRYSSREEAGRRLARSAEHLRRTDPVVLALPRGGLPVAHAFALALGADLDVLVVRKLGVPWRPELAMGAIAEGGFEVLNEDVIRHCEITPDSIRGVEMRERIELERRAHLLRAGRARIDLSGRTIVIVDDGMATGATAEVACRAARAEGATRVILAVPVASPDAFRRLTRIADDVLCPWTPTDSDSVSAAYDDFHQLDDREAVAILRDTPPV